MITVRQVTEGDWPLVQLLRLEGLRDTPEAFGSTYEDTSLWDEERWKLVAREWNYFIAEVDGESAGLLSGSTNLSHPGTWWMFGMYVRPQYRGQGTADALVDRVVLWAKSQGASELYLHVTETVERARRFYEKMGFELNGQRIVMDRDPSISLVTMVKRLD